MTGWRSHPDASVARLPPRPRPLALSALLILATLGAGLAIRLVPIGLPGRIVKHGGSILWALMIYWIVSTILGRRPPRQCALVAAAVAWSVEVSQLYHGPLLDAFRGSGAGALLLGRVFSGWDLLAYAAAAVLGAAIDPRRRDDRPAIDRLPHLDRSAHGPANAASRDFDVR